MIDIEEYTKTIKTHIFLLFVSPPSQFNVDGQEYDSSFFDRFLG